MRGRAYRVRSAGLLHLLYVEGDLPRRVLAAPGCADAGYSVTAATNGAEALDALWRKRPDLILLDLMMPIMDGASFVEACREAPECGDIPIVMMTAAGRRGYYPHLDVDGWVDKPFDI